MGVIGKRERTRRRAAKRGRPRRSAAAMRALADGLVHLARKYAPATVRQLYYQAVVSALVRKVETEYRKISELLVDLREHERVPWEAIADRTRWQRKPPTWPNIRSAFESVRQYYRREVWRGLPDRVFVALEKEALVSIVYDVTQEYDVPLLVLRGFSSVTFIHDLASQIVGYRQYGLRSHVLVLTDLDPSGVVSAGSLRDRLAKYCGIPLTPKGRAPDKLPDWLSFTRIAVTRQLAKEYNLPSRPTKTRRNSHAQSPLWDGGPSIELDAVAPDVFRQIIREVITAYIPDRHMETLRAAEESERDGLQRLEALLPDPEDEDPN